MESGKLVLIAGILVLSLAGLSQGQGQGSKPENEEVAICGDKQALQTESTTDMKFIKNVVNDINHRRVAQGWKKLKLNYQLCKVAQHYVNIMAATETFAHPPGNCGQSVLKGFNRSYEPGVVVKAWYQGMIGPVFSGVPLTQPTIPNTVYAFLGKSWTDEQNEHVGKNVREICVGMARSDKGHAYITAFYYPVPKPGSTDFMNDEKSKEMAGTGTSLQKTVWISSCVSAIVSISALLLGYNYHVYYLMMFL